MSITEATRNFKHVRTPCECEFCWRFKREPRLGRNHLSVIEALTDSAKQMLIHNNLVGVNDRLSRILKICHKIIVNYPADPDNPRCKAKDQSGKGSCNLPLIDDRCGLHGIDGLNGNIQSTLEEVFD